MYLSQVYTPLVQDPRGEMISSAGPSEAVEVVGLNGLPMAGDAFTATKDESMARQIAEVCTTTLYRYR